MTPPSSRSASPIPSARRISFVLSLALASSGCSLGPGPKGFRPDPASIRTIGFHVSPDNLSGAGSERLASMAERVAKNLGTWGYRIEADPEESGTGYSHVMEGKIGEVSHKSTPTGFSFSMGNSDPRALDFQKADVIPVDCVLHAPGRPKEKASLYMDFVATEKLKTAAKSDPALIDAYVEHIATVCFNLLEDLKVPRVQAKSGEASSSSTPSWMPEVRVEIRDKPANPLSVPAAAPAVAPAVTTSPAAQDSAPAAATPPPLKAGAPPQPQAPATAAEPPTAPQAPPVTTETRMNQEEGRKQMIIHNQGSPIILEFGYERK